MNERVPTRTRRLAGRMSKARTRKATVATQLADERALDLRVTGLTMRGIAQQLKCSVSTAHDRVERALAVRWRAGAEKAEQVRAIEVERLDALLAAWWPAALSGDPDAAAVVLKCADRRAKLFGLDTPQRVEVAGALLMVDYGRATTQQLERIAAARHDHAALTATLAAVAAEQAGAASVAAALPEAAHGAAAGQDEGGET